MTWAEFDELFAGAPRDIDWAGVGFDPSLPLVDVGPGTGRDLVRLARALPEAELLAVEPDDGMRAVLATRITADADLAARVSIIAEPIGRAPLPAQCGGVAAMGVLCFLSPAERTMFWRRFHQVLAAGGVVVFEAGDAPHPTEAERPRLVQTRQLGRWRHERWFSQRPVGPDEVQVVNEVRIFDDDHLLRVSSDRRTTWVLGDTAKRREAREAGFHVSDPDGSGVVIARRR